METFSQTCHLSLWESNKWQVFYINSSLKMLWLVIAGHHFSRMQVSPERQTFCLLLEITCTPSMANRYVDRMATLKKTRCICIKRKERGGGNAYGGSGWRTMRVLSLCKASCRYETKNGSTFPWVACCHKYKSLNTWLQTCQFLPDIFIINAIG